MYLLDTPIAWALGFQDSGSLISRGIYELHDYIMFYLILIFILVSYMLIYILIYFYRSNTGIKRTLIDKTSIHGVTIELLWTIFPTIILLLIAYPSFRLLYMIDEVIDPDISIKAIGRQWYWTYEYGDYSTVISFDSYIVPDSDLLIGQYRLLETDNDVVLPVDTHVRVLTTASDVIHSWGIPSLGLKADAIPGRLNASSLFISRTGKFYGMCSELCRTWT